MSRHRSPGARTHPDRIRGARAFHDRPVRSGLAAAAAVGGTLAVAVPLAATDAPPAAPQTLLRTSDGTATPAAGPGAVRLAAVLPVVTRDEPLPPQAQADDLVKAADLAELSRRAGEAAREAAREAAQEAANTASCDVDLDGLGRVKPWVRDAAGFLSCLYDRPALIGVAGRGRVSDHPAGLAVDLMVRGERGDRLAACALANREALGLEYVIWEQRIHHGSGWEPMADRGGDTENHMDHVHMSFSRRAPGGTPLADLCE